jgi:catechol 2,3-dioxygenase-like lactoylglutathione lyase family enzyme
MACKFTELVIDCADADRVGEFWSEVLGYPVSDRDEDSVEIKSPDGALPSLFFATVPEPKTIKNRLHIDVNATDRAQADEVERIIALGARRVDIGQGDVTWVVLADPEGNEFCVLRSRVEA